MNSVRLDISVALGLLLLLVSGHLLVQAWGMNPDLRSGLEPEILSTRSQSMRIDGRGDA